MKKICLAFAIMIAFISLTFTAPAQALVPVVSDSVIQPYPLSITYLKTTNLIFPFAIKNVDIGSRDVIAQKAKGVENVLQLKAAKMGFDETNLTVITADGRLNSYLLNYADTPTVLNVRFSNKMQWNPQVFFSANEITEAEVQSDAEAIVYEKRNLRRTKDNSFGMNLRLDGIFVHDNVMYFRVKIANSSRINYDISQLRFFIRDQKKSKRTASQELDLYPLYAHNDTSVIAGKSKRVIVFAVPKFTIADKKYLFVQMMEKNGGRHLQVRLKNKSIMKAKAIS